MTNQSQYDGGTALHRAAEVGSLDCAHLLLDHGADPNAPNQYGHTPFHAAAAFEQPDMARLLYNRSGRPSCHKNCAVCKNMSKQLLESERRRRSEADKAK